MENTAGAPDHTPLSTLQFALALIPACFASFPNALPGTVTSHDLSGYVLMCLPGVDLIHPSRSNSQLSKQQRVTHFH